MPIKKTETAKKTETGKKIVKKTTAAKKVNTEVVNDVRLADTSVVSELFKTNEQTETKEEVAPNSVMLYVNGKSKGAIDTTGKTVSEFAMEQASRNSIRTFSLYVDGVKADTGIGSKSMEAYTKIELVSKDSRGM